MRMNTTLVINPKGGAGKTTVAINLASHFAAANTATTLMDYDPQGSSLHCLRSRAPGAAKIHGANAGPPKPDRLRSFERYVPPETRQLVIDTPAGASGLLLQEMLGRAHCVIIPVVPSSLDIHATANFIKDLLLKGRIRERNIRLARAGALTVAGVSALAMAQALLPRYAQAQTISFTDERMKAQYMNYPSSAGNSGSMRGYLARPAGPGPFPSVLVIHENRGLNPYIEDVARRAAVEGFFALAPDGLSPVGGYPGNDDDGRTLQAGLDQGKLRADMLNSARFLKSHKSSSGKLGVTGFCWGGGTTNFLAAALGAEMHAGAAFYGAAAETADVPRIKAPLLIHYAETDERINAMWPAFEAALKAAGVPHQMHRYPGTQHGFHNNSTPRYNEAAAKLAWERTIAFFRKNLA